MIIDKELKSKRQVYISMLRFVFLHQNKHCENAKYYQNNDLLRQI